MNKALMNKALVNNSSLQVDYFSVPRRSFLSGMLLGGAGFALPPLASAHVAPPPTGLVQGPIVNIIPELRTIVRDPDVAQFLMAITESMGELGALTLPAHPAFEKVRISAEERSAIQQTIDEVVGSLVNELPAGESLTEKELHRVRHESQKRVIDFLAASRTEMTDIKTLWMPLNQASVPTTAAIGNAFLVHDSAGPNLAIIAPMATAVEEDKLLLKLAILAGLVAAIVAAVLAAIEIKVPAVKTDKLVPIIAKAIQNPAGRTAFLTMIEIIKKEGVTLGEKVAAILAFLKTLWNLGALKEILIEMLAGFSIFDLVLTLAGIAAIFLTAGASFVLKFTGIAVGLLAALVSAGAAYQKLQQS